MASKSNVLYAAAKEIGTTCNEQNRDFLACKARDENPEACLEVGAKVQDCALGVLHAAVESCGDALAAYAKCLDRQVSEEYMFDRCRAEENVFKACRNSANSGAKIVARNPVEKDCGGHEPGS